MLFSIAFYFFEGINPMFLNVTVNIKTAKPIGMTEFKIAPIHIPLTLF
jgi:hypothetical protein